MNHNRRETPYISSAFFSNKKTALVLAHLGHELRVFGWLTQTRPHVCVLTDGSGRRLVSRLDRTVAILKAAQAPAGPILGRYADQRVYQALLANDHRFFLALADELSAWLVKEQMDFVLSDAAEGYNSTHDVCRMLCATATTLASRQLKREISHYDFLLVAHPASRQSPDVISLCLDNATLQAKIAQALAYEAISNDVNHALNEFGDEAFRHEILCPSQPFALSSAPPFMSNLASNKWQQAIIRLLSAIVNICCR